MRKLVGWQWRGGGLNNKNFLINLNESKKGEKESKTTELNRKQIKW